VQCALKSGHAEVIEDYTITGPTLEEVFMNVARGRVVLVGSRCVDGYGRK